MKELICFLIVFNSVTLSVFAQQKQADFEMKLFFEDAKSNRDSLIFGYDSTADYNFISSKLGEDSIISPLDSIFDIRIGKSDDFWNSPKLGKKRIAHIEGSGECIGFAWLFIVINTKYNPVKITYNASLLNNSNQCLQNTVIAKNQSIHLVEDGWFNAPKQYWFCMASQNEIMIDTREKKTTSPYKSFYDSRKYEVIGKGINDVPVISLQNFSAGPCQYLIRNNDINFKKAVLLQSPVRNVLSVIFDENNAFTNNTQLQILHASGQILQQQQVNENLTQLEVDVSMLPSGLYFVQIRSPQGLSYTGKFVKIE
jgi:hypothetical protein